MTRLNPPGQNLTLHKTTLHDKFIFQKRIPIERFFPLLLFFSTRFCSFPVLFFSLFTHFVLYVPRPPHPPPPNTQLKNSDNFAVSPLITILLLIK